MKNWGLSNTFLIAYVKHVSVQLQFSEMKARRRTLTFICCLLPICQTVFYIPSWSSKHPKVSTIHSTIKWNMSLNTLQLCENSILLSSNALFCCMAIRHGKKTSRLHLCWISESGELGRSLSGPYFSLDCLSVTHSRMLRAVCLSCVRETTWSICTSVDPATQYSWCGDIYTSHVCSYEWFVITMIIHSMLILNISIKLQMGNIFFARHSIWSTTSHFLICKNIWSCGTTCSFVTAMLLKFLMIGLRHSQPWVKVRLTVGSQKDTSQSTSGV